MRCVSSKSTVPASGGSLSERGKLAMTGALPANLSMLKARLDRRVSVQPRAPDLMPAPDVNLVALLHTYVPESNTKPMGPRSNMDIHVQRLTKIFAGRTNIELLHAVAVSYLRRKTPHTEKAWGIFQG